MSSISNLLVNSGRTGTPTLVSQTIFVDLQDDVVVVLHELFQEGFGTGL